MVKSAASRRSSAPPWAPNRRAGVLGAGVALDQRLEQVADRRGERDAERRAAARRCPRASPGRARRTTCRRSRDEHPDQPGPRPSCSARSAAPAAGGRTCGRRGRRRCRRGTCPTSTSTMIPSPCGSSRSSTAWASASPIQQTPNSVTAIADGQRARARAAGIASAEQERSAGRRPRARAATWNWLAVARGERRAPASAEEAGEPDRARRVEHREQLVQADEPEREDARARTPARPRRR